MNTVQITDNKTNYMDIRILNDERKELNQLMSDSDEFFKTFGELDNNTYSGGTIPKKYKELTGLSISVLSRCEECILHHIQECIIAGASYQELIEAIKIGVIGGGSITYPSARFAFRVLKIDKTTWNLKTDIHAISDKLPLTFQNPARHLRLNWSSQINDNLK